MKDSVYGSNSLIDFKDFHLFWRIVILNLQCFDLPAVDLCFCHVTWLRFRSATGRVKRCTFGITGRQRSEHSSCLAYAPL